MRKVEENKKGKREKRNIEKRICRKGRDGRMRGRKSVRVENNVWVKKRRKRRGGLLMREKRRKDKNTEERETVYLSSVASSEDKQPFTHTFSPLFSFCHFLLFYFIYFLHFRDDERHFPIDFQVLGK